MSPMKANELAERVGFGITTKARGADARNALTNLLRLAEVGEQMSLYRELFEKAKLRICDAEYGAECAADESRKGPAGAPCDLCSTVVAIEKEMSE